MFPMDSDGKALTEAIWNGGFSLAAALVLLLSLRFMIDWSASILP